jgi:hypothetical protein
MKIASSTISLESQHAGAVSGNGFADLARYDTDGNHWIDENGSIFADLRA